MSHAEVNRFGESDQNVCPRHNLKTACHRGTSSCGLNFDLNIRKDEYQCTEEGF